MPDNNKKMEFLKKMTFKQVFYPTASFVFALSVVLFFFFSVKFIVTSVDVTFYVPSDAEVAGQIVTFDRANYILVAKKLGISVAEVQPGGIIPSTEVPVEEAPQIETQEVATTTPTVVDKKSIKIAIYNSTKIAGVAAKLKAVLTGEGFEVLETGNKAPLLEITTVKIKEELLTSPLVEEIKTLVGSKYQIISEANATASTFDVEIIIGGK